MQIKHKIFNLYIDIKSIILYEMEKAYLWTQKLIANDILMQYSKIMTSAWRSNFYLVDNNLIIYLVSWDLETWKANRLSYKYLSFLWKANKNTCVNHQLRSLLRKNLCFSRNIWFIMDMWGNFKHFHLVKRDI